MKLPQNRVSGLHLATYVLIALILMFLDIRSGWLVSSRYIMQSALEPIQLALNLPSRAWRWSAEIFQERALIQEENKQLRAKNLALELETINFVGLLRDNTELRKLQDTSLKVTEHWLPAEIISVQENARSIRLRVNRGTQHGIFKAQTVIANGALLGQSISVGASSTEIILLSDWESAVPVQNIRTGVRTLAFGTGNSGTVSLPFLPFQTDIRAGDMLVTSGLGGVFPAGLPVARVSEVRRDGISPLVQVTAQTIANIDSDRIVAFIWLKPMRKLATP